MSIEEIKNDRKVKTDVIDKHIGQKLQDIRKKLGLSQLELGNKVGVTFQQIQKYEKGTNRMAGSTIFELSNILNIPVNYFFEGFNEVLNSEEIEEFKKSYSSDTTNFARISKYFSKIENEEVRECSVDLIKAIYNLDRKIAKNNV